MDIDDGQIQKANENINFAEVGDRIHVMKASSMSKKNKATYTDGYPSCNNSKDLKELSVLLKLIFLLCVL